LDYKRNNFLNLLNNNYLLTKPSYTKGDTWLKLLGHSNSLYIRAIRATTSHVSIGKYYLRFFSRKSFKCLCRSYLTKSRCYILHKCRRYKNYWNSNRESLKNFVVFLEFNPGAFSFHKDITVFFLLSIE